MARVMALAGPALLVTALACGDDAGSPAGPVGPPAAAATAATSPLAFRQVSAGENHTCGVTTDDKAYCWGRGLLGELGNGTRFGPELCEQVAGCSSRPVAVLGGVRFRSVSAGSSFTCGVATDARAWCWGSGALLGDGTTSGQLKPVAVHGGHLFRQVSTAGSHTCGLTTDNRIYCWGGNGNGELGDGTQATRLVPKAVAGGRTWRLVSAGEQHTCALTTDNQAFCWGANFEGQLGDSTAAPRRLVPVRVAGSRRFTQLSSGASHTCAVATDARAFCWGFGGYGALGKGDTTSVLWPKKAVAGGLAFDRITSGRYHTCAEAAGNKAYCWGRNSLGQLGIGTLSGPNVCALGQPCSTRPMAVVGGRSFVQVDAGRTHVCARTGSNLAFCWGDSFDGKTGVGTTQGEEKSPARVLGPL